MSLLQKYFLLPAFVSVETSRALLCFAILQLGAPISSSLVSLMCVQRLN